MMPLAEEVAVFSFPIPRGFRAPEDVPDGEAFDATVKVRIQDGKVMVDSINGSALGEEMEEDEMEEDEVAENEEESEYGEEDGESLEAAMLAMK